MNYVAQAEGMELVRTPAARQPNPPQPAARPPARRPLPAAVLLLPLAEDLLAFLSLVVQLAFYKTNPRYGLKDAKGNLVAPAASDATAIVKSLKEFVSSVLPNLNKGKAGEFRKILKSDPTASEIVASYTDRLRDWHANLEDAAAAPGAGVIPEFLGAMARKNCVGQATFNVTGASGAEAKVTCALTAAQTRTAFLDAQSAPSLVVDGPSAKLEVVVEALARCGDIKYAGVSEMSFAMRVRGMLQLVLSEATDQEVVEEILGGGGADGGAGAPVGGAGGAAVDAKALR